MNLYRFEVREQIITRIEVLAVNEQEARERVFRQDESITAFDAIRGDLRLVLRHVDKQ